MLTVCPSCSTPLNLPEGPGPFACPKCRRQVFAATPRPVAGAGCVYCVSATCGVLGCLTAPFSLVAGVLGMVAGGLLALQLSLFLIAASLDRMRHIT